MGGDMAANERSVAQAQAMYEGANTTAGFNDTFQAKLAELASLASSTRDNLQSKLAGPAFDDTMARWRRSANAMDQALDRLRELFIQVAQTYEQGAADQAKPLQEDAQTPSQPVGATYNISGE
jgi:uncharacterized protein YukE